ncbi:MAG: cysteine desulfurase family protein [Pseudomonadota bacterium]
MIYLDYNATAPLRPEAKDAMASALEIVGNPSSPHRFGRDARALIEDAREAVAKAVGALPEQILFTSGGTEANAMALKGASPQNWLVGSDAHPSLAFLFDERANRLPIDADGRIDHSDIERIVQSNAGRVTHLALVWANNETGVIHPIRDLANLATELGLTMHIDGVQWLGKGATDFAELGAMSLSISAHKIGGPAGVGALILKDVNAMPPIFAGGGQERRRRGGTENLLGIVGFGAAVKALGSIDEEASRLQRLKTRLEAELESMGARIVAQSSPRLANTTMVITPGMPSQLQLMKLDLAGIACSAGSACSSGKVEGSAVLSAMGFPGEEARRALRISMGRETTEGEIDTFLFTYRDMLNRAGAQSVA